MASVRMTWRDVFDGNKASYDTIYAAAATAAKAGYAYMAWNDRVYETAKVTNYRLVNADVCSVSRIVHAEPPFFDQLVELVGRFQIHIREEEYAGYDTVGGAVKDKLEWLVSKLEFLILVDPATKAALEARIKHLSERIEREEREHERLIASIRR